MIGTIHLIRVTFREDDVFEGSIPRECYENARTDDFEMDNIEEAVTFLQRSGLTFATTGTDWAANPDGTTIVDYATAEREETTAHLHGFTDADVAAIIERVG